MGYQFTKTVESECSSCDGSGVIEYSPTIEIPDSDGLLLNGVDRVLQAFSIEKDCEVCGGSGSVEETRERHIDELTSTQMTFLYEAQYERKKAENGGDEAQEQVEQTQQQIPPDVNPGTGGVGGGPPVSNPTGKPPAKGNIRQF